MGGSDKIFTQPSNRLLFFNSFQKITMEEKECP